MNPVVSVEEIAEWEVKMSSGPYGSDTLIRENAERWYRKHKVVSALSYGVRLHPLDERSMFDVKFVGGNDLRQLSHSYSERTGSEAFARSVLASDALRDKALAQLVSSWLGVSVKPMHDEPGAVEKITDICQTIADVLPRLTWTTLPFVTRLHVATSADLSGVTWPELPGLVVLGETMLSSTAMGSEALLHEAVHLKMAKISLGFEKVLSTNDSSIQVSIPWRITTEGNHEHWALLRALNAFHVYVHICLYYAALLASSEKCDFWVRRRFRTAILRSEYLASELSALGPKGLDDQRLALRDWLIETRIPVKRLLLMAT